MLELDRAAVRASSASPLCMSQWRVAAFRPLLLKAILPWEGMTDLIAGV